MVSTFESKPVITSPDVRSFFETSLQEVSLRQGVGATQPTLTYVAGMLTRFSRTEAPSRKNPRWQAHSSLYASLCEGQLSVQCRRTLRNHAAPWRRHVIFVRRFRRELQPQTG